MKNLILFTLICSNYYLSFSASMELNLPNFHKYVSDTTLTAKIDQYYLVHTDIDRINNQQSIRRIDSEWSVVIGKNLINTDKKNPYYLLDNKWKLTNNATNVKNLTSENHTYSIKITSEFDFSFFKNNKIELIRHLPKANIVLIKTSLDEVYSSVLPNPYIIFVDLAERVAVEESPLRQFGSSINRINKAQLNYPHLKGANQKISLKENSIFEDDIDLNGKVIIDEQSSTAYTQHAKEMGTIIMGYGNSYHTGKGVVPEAVVVCTDFQSLFSEPTSYYQSHHVFVQNHSYGTGIENFYGNESISYDQTALDIPELLHVFSAGNAGSAAPEFGTYAGINGYANITGTFKQSKNSLVIAALDSTMQHEPLTSSGPAYDGRIKPELAAFGPEGSSESAAIVSGCVAMLQEHYSNLHGAPANGALIKSILIAGANEAGLKGIDFNTGYGSVNLDRSLKILQNDWIMEDVLSSHDLTNYPVVIPAHVSELKIVLSWADPPANPEDATALINDLNLSVVDSEGVTWLPWVLNSSGDAALLAAPATRRVDHLNNVEMITLEHPKSGNCMINISSSQLATDHQNFSIAYSIKYKDTFEWSYPMSIDRLEANAQTRLRWENTYDNQLGLIYVKYGTGEWLEISSVNPHDEQLSFVVPDRSSIARLKMVIGSDEYVSEEFTISKSLSIIVENDCENEVSLSWTGLDDVESYAVYAYQGVEMALAFVTSDTLINLDKAIYNSEYYAVNPIFEGQEGLRSFATNYTQSNKGCFLENFLIRLNDEGGADLSLLLNAPYDVENATITKQFDSSNEVFQAFLPGDQKEFNFTDTYNTAGVYRYKTTLALKNGARIHSDTLEVYFTTEDQVIVFPNPLVDDDFVNVLNDNPGGQLILFDSGGNKIQSFDLVNNVEVLDLSQVQKGVYIFRIIVQGKTINMGKIVKLL